MLPSYFTPPRRRKSPVHNLTAEKKDRYKSGTFALAKPL